MPRKKASDTANTDADQQSVSKTQDSQEASTETPEKKTTRRRRITADDILGKEEEKATPRAKASAKTTKSTEDKAQEEKPKRRTTKTKASTEETSEEATPAEKPKTAAKAAPKTTTKAPAEKAVAKRTDSTKPEPQKPEPQKAAPAEAAQPSKKLFGRRTLADEVAEEKLSPKKPAPKKVEPKQVEAKQEDPKPVEKKEAPKKAASPTSTKAKSTTTTSTQKTPDGGDPYSVSIELSWRTPDGSPRPVREERPDRNERNEFRENSRRDSSRRESSRREPSQRESARRDDRRDDRREDRRTDRREEQRREDYRREIAPPLEEYGDPIDLGDEAGRMRILTWRTASPAPSYRSEPKVEFRSEFRSERRAEQKDEEEPEPRADRDSESRLAPRKSRSKRRRDLPEGEITAADAYNDEIKPLFRKRGEETPRDEEVDELTAAQVEVPAPPTVQVREPIARSEEAAQVVVHEDHPKIIKDKVAYAPFVFYAGALSGKTEAQVTEAIKLAAEHGVHLFMFAFDLVNDLDQTEQTADTIIAQAKKCLELAPNAQILVRLNFVPASNWKSKFPDARDLTATVGQNIPSLCDDAYWKSTEESLKQVVSAIRESEVSDSVMGVHLDRNRWEFDPADGYDTSVAAVQQFRSWLRHRYRNDVVTLRASWFDGKVDFSTAEVPEPGFTDKAGEFVRTDRKARRWIDYHLFLSDMTVDRIGELCYAAKAASEGDFLVGVTYGSTFESSHPASGQLSLGKLLRCPELDYISAAPTIEKILPGSAAPFPFPVDSFALNGKLFLIEEDYRTPISGQSDDDQAPLMRTPQALEAVHWRGAGASLAHHGGLIWCDHKGKGWLNSRGIWERGAKVREALLKNLTTPTSQPEAVVFIDERSLTYLADEQSFVSLIQDVRESALRSGLSVGFYLLSDLAHRENFPEAKLHVFLNAWDMRPEVRSAIKSRLQRDGKVLFWLYTAGLFEAGRESLERVREVTGIALRPQPYNSKSGTTVLNTTEPLGQAIPQDQLSEGGKLEPSYFAIPEDGNVIAEYTSTGLPSLLVKPFDADKPEQNWTSVFLGEPMVTPAFFRALGQLAGCHVWNFDNDIVHAAAPNLTVHCTETGSRTITLPSKWVAYDLKAGDYMPVENNTVKFKALDGATYSFLVGTIGDVQKIVKAEIDTIRKITSPIIRDENTLHWDTIRFDVEIMKLDEWVEETWSDELADDLLLKPSLLDVDSDALMEAPEDEPEEDARRSEPGRRRRRKRRGSKPQRRSDFDHGGSDDNDGIGVLFRKRD